MSLATLGGVSVTALRMQVPAWGVWWADVHLAEDVALAGAQTLVLADVTCACTIVSGGAAHGTASYRVVGGKGGWSRSLPKKPYLNDAGVKASLVLADAAREAGETLSGVPTTRLGPHFARAEGLASAVLHLLAPRSWYVGLDGVTRFGARTAIAYTGDGARTRVDPAGAIVEIATEQIAQLVPGVTVDGSLPATDVEYILDAKRLTVRVYAGARTSRRLEAFARMLDALDPVRKYRGVYEFRVVTQAGERLNLQPVRAASGLPDLANVPVRPGVSGCRANVTPGELVMVAFADADPSRPFVFAHDSADAPGWMPLSLELGGPLALGVARLTDPVQAGPFAGVITGASARVKASL